MTDGHRWGLCALPKQGVSDPPEPTRVLGCDLLERRIAGVPDVAAAEASETEAETEETAKVEEDKTEA